MDELGKLFQSLLDGASAESSAEAPSDPVTPESADEPAAEAFSPSDGGDLDFGALLGAFSPGDDSAQPLQNQKLQLLCALKPYLRDARRRKLERVESLLSTAYSVRSLLSSLGGILNV